MPTTSPGRGDCLPACVDERVPDGALVEFIGEGEEHLSTACARAVSHTDQFVTNPCPRYAATVVVARVVARTVGVWGGSEVLLSHTG